MRLNVESCKAQNCQIKSRKNVFCAVTFLHCYSYICSFFSSFFIIIIIIPPSIQSCIFKSLWFGLYGYGAWLMNEYTNSHTEKCVRLCAQYDDKYHNSWLDYRKATERMKQFPCYVFTQFFRLLLISDMCVYRYFYVCMRIHHAKIYICWIFHSILFLAINFMLTDLC